MQRETFNLHVIRDLNLCTCALAELLCSSNNKTLFYILFYSISARSSLTFSATCINLYIDFGKYNSGSFPWGDIRDKIAVENSAYVHARANSRNDCPREVLRGTKKFFSRSWHDFRTIMVFRRSLPLRRLSYSRGEYQQTKQIKQAVIQ